MKLKKYEVYLADKATHKVAAQVHIVADGYMTALAEANKVCASNHEGLYVGRVQEVLK